MISSACLNKAKVALGVARKELRNLNEEILHHQNTLNENSNLDLLFRLADEIMDTVDRLKDARRKLSKAACEERENNPEARGGL